MPVESFTARHPRYILTFIVVSLVFILFHVISPPASPFPGPRWGPRPPPFDFGSRGEVNAMYCGRMTGEQGWEHPPHHWGPPPAHDGRPYAWGPPPEHHHHEHKPFWGPPPERHDGHAEGMPPPPPSQHGPHHNGPPHFWGPPPPGHHHDHPEGMPPPPAHWSDEDEHHHYHHGPPPPHFWGPPPHRHEDHGDFQERPPRPEHYHQGPPPHRHEEHQHHHEKQGNDEEIPQSDVESLRCPHTMQLLGESWVCGFERIAAKEECVVYSIGIAGESSFEGSVLKESEGCVVFGYDSKVESFGAGVPADSTRAKFSVLETTESALSTMQTNGHDFIDILKIELNDEADFVALEALLNQSLARKPRLPFGQILLTVKSELSPIAAIFEKIQRMGMSPFFAGPSASKDAFDYAFINIPREHKHKVDARPDAETPAPVAQV
ncbi:hypothetical protein BDZ89DRAFT_1069496 [Hymenopellis radicata]|nr:hypothetical protein BDZ89DRAFT_1069496 [Hymenopellis radicata]